MALIKIDTNENLEAIKEELFKLEKDI